MEYWNDGILGKKIRLLLLHYSIIPLFLFFFYLFFYSPWNLFPEQ